MTLTLLTPAAAEPVSVAEAKAHLRVTFAEEDALIASLITAARERVEAELGLCLIETGLREVGFAWPSEADGSVALARGPLDGVDAVSRIEPDGSLTALSYTAAEAGARPGRITVTGGEPWTVRACADAPRLQIDYRAGFGPTAGDVPETLRQAVLALVADAYERRGEPVAAGSSAAQPWLAPWRRLRL